MSAQFRPTMAAAARRRPTTPRIVGSALGVLGVLLSDCALAQADRDALERLAALRRGIGDRPSTRDEVATAFRGDRAAARRALEILSRTDLHHPDLAALFAFARAEARRRKPRLRAVTIPPEALPASLKADLAALAADPRRATRRADALWDPVDEMERALCMLCRAAQRAGLPERFDDDAIGASIVWHIERGCSARSILAHLVILDRFARSTGRSFGLRGELRYWRSAASLERKKKEDVIEASGLTPDGLRERAAELQRAAEAEADPFVARMLWQQAALVALSSEIPLRRSDIVVLRLGLELACDAAGWRIDLVTRKEGVRIAARLDKRIAPFLDGAVLLGAVAHRFDALYDDRIGAPMFTTLDGAALTPNAVTRLYRLAIGTGGHLARTLIYDACAATPAGEAEAAARCGHKGFGGSRAYLSDAGRRTRSAAAINRYQKALRQIGFGRSRIAGGDAAPPS